MRSRSETNVVIHPAIDVAVERLARLTHAEAILLFGSRARGDYGPDSDWDLFVILPDNSRPGEFTPVTLWPAVSDLGIPIQISSARQNVFDAKRNDVNSISHDADRDGIILCGSLVQEFAP